MGISIAELKDLSNEDMAFRIRERIVDMYQRIGDNDDALVWLWKDIVARQQGE